MKKIYGLLVICFSLAACKVDRYFFVTQEQIHLYEFPSFSGAPVLTTGIGDTVSTTGTKATQIGGAVPIEYRGYRFYSPFAKVRLVAKTKIDPKSDHTAPGITYLPRMKAKEEEAARLAYERQRAEDLKIDWFGQVSYQAFLLEAPSTLAKTIETIPAKTIMKVKWYNEGFWQVTYNGKVGYVHMYQISYFSRSERPFVRTAYNGSFGDNDHDPRTNTPTTGATIYTGPRGGRYYINSHGNKTYVPRNSSYGGYRSRSSGSGRGRK